MRQKFHGFRTWPNIWENFICELGVLVVLSHDCGQHLRKFYLQFFIFGAIFPALWYIDLVLLMRGTYVQSILADKVYMS